MKLSIAALTLVVSSFAMTVLAQFPGAGPGGPNVSAPKPALGAPNPFATAPKKDDQLLPANASLPEPVHAEQVKPTMMALPQDPIEPYLLTKDAGPFMVIAKSFRGPESDRFALALALELRRAHNLPAYVLRSKDFPGKSNIRNIPPTAPPGVDRARLGDPEKVRTYDEAVVLVGDEKTQKGAEALLHQVRKIRPKCLDGMPSFWAHREGLRYALRTTNPYVPAQNLFSGKSDPLVVQMNQGPRSIFHCPGRFSLQVADFTGRSSFNVSGVQSMGDAFLKRSPLMTAHDDAERLASALEKSQKVRQTGQSVYVYHDRTSSKVLVGSFNGPNDPAALQVRNHLLQAAVPLMQEKKGVDTMIAPANYLTDLASIKPN